MSEHINNNEKLLARMERLEKGLSVKIQAFSESQQALEQCMGELVIEIEEIKNLKISLKEVIVGAVKDSSEALVPQILPSIINRFEEKTRAFVESSLKGAEQLKDDINQAIFQTKKIITSQKKAITRRKFALNIAICGSVLLTALSLFYFFPQNITYGVSSTMAGAIVLGETVMDHSDQLTPEQREYFLKKASEKLRVRKGHK